MTHAQNRDLAASAGNNSFRWRQTWRADSAADDAEHYRAWDNDGGHAISSASSNTGSRAADCRTVAHIALSILRDVQNWCKWTRSEPFSLRQREWRHC